MFARPESTGVGPVGHPKRRSAFAIRRLSYLRISTGTAKIINAAASPKTTAARFGRPRAYPRSTCQNGIIPLSSLLQTSNNIIQKGLAFGREQSGTVTVPGARRALGILPRRLQGQGGAAVVAAMTPHQRNGG